MPIYEYWCNNCNKKVDLYLSKYPGDIPLCPSCKQNSMQKLVSRFSTHRTYKDVYNEILSDSQLTKRMMQNDPRALAEWNKKMSGGEPVSPEYQEAMEKMERGEMPVPSFENPAPPPDSAGYTEN